MAPEVDVASSSRDIHSTTPKPELQNIQIRSTLFSFLNVELTIYQHTYSLAKPNAHNEAKLLEPLKKEGKKKKKTTKAQVSLAPLFLFRLNNFPLPCSLILPCKDSPQTNVSHSTNLAYLVKTLSRKKWSKRVEESSRRERNWSFIAKIVQRS
ncbi:hypothetical protein L249_2746 [Ophiocordyceps polyrhachis-furcata BCC 54312]|uniref:Uncharacterized protein n=1 Tax=Ophiocordyceps polyrhachis-furcata BCC 54312 TaxID=1330021 RepID=A0A367LQ48_9HYPO|nr:hypothetical protein L249_2746 [Ophiocordyceps polyrhachis-furcata BCC 54312]